MVLALRTSSTSVTDLITIASSTNHSLKELTNQPTGNRRRAINQPVGC